MTREGPERRAESSEPETPASSGSELSAPFSGPTVSSPSGLKRMLRALDHPNYRLFFAGQTASLVGSWMQETAMPWLVFTLTDSPFWLGVVGFSARIPAFFLAPLAGVAADRWERRNIIMLTQAVALAQALALGVLTFTGWIETWQIVLLALLLGVTAAFSLPATQACVADIVDKTQDLPSAVALNAAMVNLARMLAPALAGVLIAAGGRGRTGEATCFLLNAASYLALLGALWMIRPPRVAPRPIPSSLRAPLKEGFTYVLGHAPLRHLLVFATLIGLLGTPNTLIPIFARKIGAEDAGTYGFLLGATGAGALAGAVFVATRRAMRGAEPRIALAAGILGVSLVGFAYSDWLWAALLFRFVSGAAVVVQVTTVSTLVQLLADDDKRGRVLSIYGMAFLGMSPVGNLAAGAVASVIDARITFLLLGMGCIVTAAWFARQVPHLRTAFEARKEASIPPHEIPHMHA